VRHEEFLTICDEFLFFNPFGLPEIKPVNYDKPEDLYLFIAGRMYPILEMQERGEEF
jgi:hypothetical protein